MELFSDFESPTENEKTTQEINEENSLIVSNETPGKNSISSEFATSLASSGEVSASPPSDESDEDFHDSPKTNQSSSNENERDDEIEEDNDDVSSFSSERSLKIKKRKSVPTKRTRNAKNRSILERTRPKRNELFHRLTKSVSNESSKENLKIDEEEEKENSAGSESEDEISENEQEKAEIQKEIMWNTSINIH